MTNKEAFQGSNSVIRNNTVKISPSLKASILLLMLSLSEATSASDIITSRSVQSEETTADAQSPAGLTSTESASLMLTGELTQGSLLRGRLPVDASAGGQVWLNDKKVRVHSSGDFVFGFGRDADLEHELKWQVGNGDVNVQTIKISKRTYPTQRIEGVESKYVSPPETVLKRIRSDNQKIAKARSTSSQLLSFTEDFILPAKGAISGVYGSQRVFNGVPKRPHFGLDVAGPVGTAIIAPASGIVTLAHDDMYYSGGTLIIDHGMGISSTFIHLSKIVVEDGQEVSQGQKIAEMGATGRVTGPHLDWRINWFSERLDPALVLSEPLPK